MEEVRIAVSCVANGRTDVVVGLPRRRARLFVKRVDPWSVMKFSFAVSFVMRATISQLDVSNSVTHPSDPGNGKPWFVTDRDSEMNT